MPDHFIDRLIQNYPDFLEKREGNFLIWKDGERMPVGSSSSKNTQQLYKQPDLIDQFTWEYEKSTPENFNQIPTEDPGRIRYTPLFKKMYGSTEAEVKANLVSIPWMPKTTKKKILVTTINDIDKRLRAISSELDNLPSALKKYVAKTAGAFNWRNIEGSDNLSPHAFGIAIDINPKYANYWKWDAIDNQTHYKNNIPYEIISIFEKYGFIWGGKWCHYDTMHFEYRPEFFEHIYSPPPAKILYLTTGRESYGSQRQLQNLINNIDTNKYCPIVVHTEDMQSVEFQVPEAIQIMKLNLRSWRKVKNIFSRYFDAFRLLSFSREQKIDLIHCSYQWLYPYALFVSKRMNIPVIQHIRRPNNTNYKKLKYEHAQAIITISKRIEKELDHLKKMTHIIYDSIDDVFFKKTNNVILKKEFDLHDQVLFGIVGRVYKTKKQFEYIKAAERLLNQGINAKFFIIGRVDNEKYHQELVEYINNHHLTNDILFTGHRQDMPEIINSLDILVSLSGGSVMYEAMALGKTVISAGFTVPENSTHLIHNKTGLVTDSKDITDLVNLMKLAAEDYELRANLGENAKKIAVSHLSCQIQAAKTQQLYKQLLSNQVQPR